MSENDTAQDYASGEVGRFGFDGIGSDDPNALEDWLREQSYQVTGDMEPPVDVYVDEGFVGAFRLPRGHQDGPRIQQASPSGTISTGAIMDRRSHEDDL